MHLRMMFFMREFYYMRNSYNDAMSWIKNGDEDLHSAKILIDNNGSLRNIGFHCQQATEKYLKAFLEFNEIRFPRTHELSNLYSICFEIDSSIDIDLNFLSNLLNMQWISDILKILILMKNPYTPVIIMFRQLEVKYYQKSRNNHV